MKIFSVNVNYFHRFFRLLHISLLQRKTNDVSIQQIMSVFFYFQPTLNRLLAIVQSDIAIRLVLLKIWTEWEGGGGGSNWPPSSQKKLFLKRPALLGLREKKRERSHLCDYQSNINFSLNLIVFASSLVRKKWLLFC